MMPNDDFWKLALDRLSNSTIETLLKGRPAVVLERVARAAGATNWYVCRVAEDLVDLSKKLSPGSIVSFYFGDQLRCGYYSDEIKSFIMDIAGDKGDCIVGIENEGDLNLIVDYVSDDGELDEFIEQHGVEALLYFGEFPGPDNDGRISVTLTLPDNDGVVRSHPH